MTNKIKGQINIQGLYDSVKKGTECNQGFLYVFSEWSPSLVSERTLYLINADCFKTDIERKLFFLDKVFASKKDLAQIKWEEYV